MENGTDMCILHERQLVAEVQNRSEIAVRSVTVRRRRIVGSVIVGAVRFHMELPLNSGEGGQRWPAPTNDVDGGE